MTSATTVNPESAISSTAVRILKVATCPSLSGKSTLTYHIGCTAKSEIQFSVYANTNAGFFSQEWIALSAIQKLFDTSPSGTPITAFILYPLFQGKSLNTPYFLFAALLSEGLVRPSEIVKRCYDRTDPKAFMAEVKPLIASTVSLSPDDKPPKAKPQKVTDKPQQADDKPQKVEDIPKPEKLSRRTTTKAMPQKKS
ncbi:MAG: hypothetical protein Q8K62_03590 [Thiobacillus sp.]|nr:hypothetical protein [Thiobacillus sp.]